MKIAKWVFILLFSTAFLYADDESKLIVTYGKARVFQKPSAFSQQVMRVKFAANVVVEKTVGLWVQVKTSQGKNLGYIHRDALIDQDTFDRQTAELQKRQDAKYKKGVSGFSEEEEIAASTKGFSEEEEIAASTKGFNKDVEGKYKKQHPKYRYDLVDRINNQGDVPNLVSAYKSWRQQGSLGEYSQFNALNKK